MKIIKNAENKIERGSGNVFADAWLEDSDDILARAHLTRKIYGILRKRGMKQKEAAEILGVKQPDVSSLMNGKFVDFSVERLIRMLVRLDQEVRITVKPAREGEAAFRVIHSRDEARPRL